MPRYLTTAAATLVLSSGLLGQTQAAAPEPSTSVTLHKTVDVDGLEIFYREAGPKDAPTILLLHGFPTSSQMFRELIPALSDRFHLVAPDYPGFGQSAMPPVEAFDYSFDRLAQVMDGFVFRLAVEHPERVQALIIQNGNAYEEGLGDFWQPFRAYWADRNEATAAPLAGFLGLEATRWQYTHGTRDAAAINPDNWIVDQYYLDRPGNREIQLQLFYDYGSNPPLYGQWQAYLRDRQPPTLVVWGQNDVIFPAAGAQPYTRDLTNIELHLLDTGHFALEENGDFIAERIRAFLSRQGV
jgi:pimeloyl-ACP methyl ester carboxylesterase